MRNSTGDVVLRQPGDQVASAGWWRCCYLYVGVNIGAIAVGVVASVEIVDSREPFEQIEKQLSL